MISNIKRLFGEEFNSLLFLNLLTVALMLPIITIGPAVLALNGTLIKILNDTCARKRIGEYWGLFKKKFWKGVLLELGVGSYGAILLWCASVADQQNERGVVLWAITVLMGFLASLAGICVCQILATTELRFIDALWNGVCLTLGRLPQVLLAALGTYGALVICYLLYPVSILPLAVILLSAMAALSVSVLFPSIKELVMDASPEETQDDKNNE